MQAVADVEKPKALKSLNVQIPEDLYERLRRAAFEDRTSKAELVRAALDAYLREQGR